MADTPNVNFDNVPEGYDGVWKDEQTNPVDTEQPTNVVPESNDDGMTDSVDETPQTTDSETSVPEETTPVEETTSVPETPVEEQPIEGTDDTKTDDTNKETSDTNSDATKDEPVAENTEPTEPVNSTASPDAPDNPTVIANAVEEDMTIPGTMVDVENTIIEENIGVADQETKTVTELADVVDDTKTELTDAVDETKTELTDAVSVKESDGTTTNDKDDEERTFTAEEKEAGWAIWRDGEYGNGQERFDALEAAGLNADNVQAYVNDIAAGKVTYEQYIAELEAEGNEVTDDTKDTEANGTEADTATDTNTEGNNTDEDTTEKGDSEDKFHNFVQTMIWKAEEFGIPVASIAEKFGVNLEESGYSTEVPENTDSLVPEEGEQKDGEEEQTEGEEQPADETSNPSPADDTQPEDSETPEDGNDANGDQTEGEEEQPVEGDAKDEAEVNAWESDDYTNSVKDRIDWAYNASDAPDASIHGIQSSTAQDDYRNAVNEFRETHTQSWIYSDEELAAMPEEQVNAIKLKELAVMNDWTDDKNKDVPTNINSQADYNNRENIIAENEAIQAQRTGYLTDIAENTSYVFPTLDEATAKQIMGEDVYNDWAAKQQEFYAEQSTPEATETDATATKTDAEATATETDADKTATRATQAYDELGVADIEANGEDVVQNER